MKTAKVNTGVKKPAKITAKKPKSTGKPSLVKPNEVEEGTSEEIREEIRSEFTWIPSE